MKYANSLKYMNSFEPMGSGADVSVPRVSELCDRMGRINIGTRYIAIPSGVGGHVCAVMLESVIKSAGYRVGRIDLCQCDDSRASVFVGGAALSIEDYNKCVAELKGAVAKAPDTVYRKEEAVFALGLLACKLEACEYVIIEGIGACGTVESVCAPYDIIIAPSFCNDAKSQMGIRAVCEAIRRGVREVVSGNQSSDVYGMISGACVLSGVRLSLTAKPTLTVEEISSRRLKFSYSGRDGYVIKNPSHLARECAILVIESALAIRRDGIKMPWSSISAGLEAAVELCCFDMISMSPLVVADGADNAENVSQLVSTAQDVMGGIERLTLCIRIDPETDLDAMLGSFAGIHIDQIIAIPRCDGQKLHITRDNEVIVNSVAEAAQLVSVAASEHRGVLCFGDVSFARQIKTEFIKLMGY